MMTALYRSTQLVRSFHLLKLTKRNYSLTNLPIHTVQHTKDFFKVRTANSVNDLEFAFEIAKQENWGLATDDAECFFAADPTGFFIGELNGKKICSLSLVKYPENKLCVGVCVCVCVV